MPDISEVYRMLLQEESHRDLTKRPIIPILNLWPLEQKERNHMRKEMVKIRITWVGRDLPTTTSIVRLQDIP